MKSRFDLSVFEDGVVAAQHYSEKSLSQGIMGASWQGGAASALEGQNMTNQSRKGESKPTKLNPDNYQNWADGMEILLNAKK